MKIDDIKRERKLKGVSQWALSTRLGRSGSWLSLRECHYMPASEDDLRALQAALQQSKPGDF